MEERVAVLSRTERQDVLRLLKKLGKGEDGGTQARRPRRKGTELHRRR
jgi:hypothetical protein